MDVKNELKFGFWMAFALFIWWVIEYLLGFQKPNNDTWLYSSIISNAIIALVGMYLAMLHTKKKTPKAELRYATLALSAGLTLVASSILVIALSSIFYHFINQELVDVAVAMTKEKLVEETDPAEIAKRIEQTQAAFAPGSMGMKNFSSLVTMGFFLLLIEAVFVLKLPVGVSDK